MRMNAVQSARQLFGAERAVSAWRDLYRGLDGQP
jgi:hypothetical protein